MAIEKRNTRSGPRYEVRLRGTDGSERSRTFRTRKEAERYERDQQTAKDRGAWVDPRAATVTFGEWAQRWLDADLTKRPKSRWRDEQTLSLHILPALDGRTLASIGPTDVQGLVKSWVARGLAPSTVRRQYATLRAILTSAVDADVLARTPCRGVRLPTIERRERPLITGPDIARLASEMDERYRALVYLGAVAGLRWSEAAGLRVARLDLLRGTVAVTEGLHEVAGKLVTSPPKSAAARRNVSIPEPVVVMLADHLRRRGVTAADGDELVFVAARGGPLRYAAFRSRVWQPACERADLAGLGFHDLRRASATAMVAAGVDVRTAQERLGHADPRLTLSVYAQAVDEANRDAADRLATHFGLGAPVDAARRVRRAGPASH